MDKAFLRNALKKLRAVPFDRSQHSHVMMAPQETLDFLAMLSGMKPVFLLGRGFDDPQWIEGISAIARQMELHVIEGPLWDAQPLQEALPHWFDQSIKASKPDGNAFYVCRARGIAEAVEGSFKNPPIAIEEEARLLGYPLCCVRAHYERAALFDRAFYMVLERTGRGDIKEMQRLLREDVEMSAGTDEEEAMFKAATEFTPAAFTSFHMCDACAAGANRSAEELSHRYEKLVREIDPDLADEIAANQEGVGRVD